MGWWKRNPTGENARPGQELSPYAVGEVEALLKVLRSHGVTEFSGFGMQMRLVPASVVVRTEYVPVPAGVPPGPAPTSGAAASEPPQGVDEEHPLFDAVRQN